MRALILVVVGLVGSVLCGQASAVPPKKVWERIQAQASKPPTKEQEAQWERERQQQEADALPVEKAAMRLWTIKEKKTLAKLVKVYPQGDKNFCAYIVPKKGDRVVAWKSELSKGDQAYVARELAKIRKSNGEAVAKK